MLTQKMIIHPKVVKIYPKRDHSLQNRVIPVFFIESIYALLSSYRYIHQSARISQCQRCPIINCCKDWMNDEIKPSSDTKKKNKKKKTSKNKMREKTKNKPAVKPVFRPSLLLTLRSTESCHATPASSSSSSNIYYMSFIMEYCNVLSKISRKAKQTTNNWYWIANLVDWACIKCFFSFFLYWPHLHQVVQVSGIISTKVQR